MPLFSCPSGVFSAGMLNWEFAPAAEIGCSSYLDGRSRGKSIAEAHLRVEAEVNYPD